MKKKPRTLVFNDRNVLAEIIFDGLRNETTDVVSAPDRYKDKTSTGWLTNLYQAIFQRRLFAYISIIYSIIIRWLKKNNSSYDELLVVGIEDLYDLAPVYKKYSTVNELFFWQWNPQPKNKLKKIDFWFRIKLMKFAGFKIATFDEADANKYNLNYHPQIYSSFIAARKFNGEEQQVLKAFFVGTNKGRAQKLKELALILDEADVKADFKVVDNTVADTEDFLGVSFISSPVTYQDYIKELSQINIIVEINQEGQLGLTLRALESIFFNKKLITDNHSVKNYDFYRKSNIFVIDFEIDHSSLKKELSLFIQSPYQKLDEAIIDKYDVKSLLTYFRTL
ncbi:hypothetical protein N5923_15200 [Erwiniaceae bacterium BAC15a-03b]|uniref:Uncharacterized protein n=1 Tax=Winslowiella arboricola TaxID=2978220 RepID=A0A9J6PQ29_9GAMM|nr:hypothetical protein [Winslowiella arboricola]MCU5774291.1 hypothetical protein [Winslowiella arboricola]MCU5778838.1 hypothetical protein [Winslowiella arboricola]